MSVCVCVHVNPRTFRNKTWAVDHLGRVLKRLVAECSGTPKLIKEDVAKSGGDNGGFLIYK